MMPFYPLIQSKNSLSGIQKYILRLIHGLAGKTVLHRERLVEIVETHPALRKLCPLMESDSSESISKTFWTPRRESDRKRFNIERRDRSRRHRTIGVVWGDSRPKNARRQTLRSVFPNPEFLRYLVAEKGYDSDAALAAFARARKFQGRPDRRRLVAFNSDEQTERKTNMGYQALGYGDNAYIPEAPSRRTLTGGGFTEAQVQQGLKKMWTDSKMKTALFEVVCKRQSAKDVAAKFGFSRVKLDVYASRLRRHIRRDGQATPVPVPSRVDLHSGGNLVQ